MRDDEAQSRSRAKTFRRSLTNAEAILWSQLRQGRHRGYAFRRQHPIGPYIADFACIRARLVIELDGATHASDAERAYDARRDAYMAELGWRVQRYANFDVYENLQGVLEGIYRDIPPPSFLPREAE